MTGWLETEWITKRDEMGRGRGDMGALWHMCHGGGASMSQGADSGAGGRDGASSGANSSTQTARLCASVGTGRDLQPEVVGRCITDEKTELLIANGYSTTLYSLSYLHNSTHIYVFCTSKLEIFLLNLDPQ